MAGSTSRKKPSFSATLAIFDPSSLDPDELPVALRQLEGVADEFSLDDIITSALEADFSLEYILSAVQADTFICMKEHILSCFPPTASEFTSSPLSIQCLSRLSMSLWGLKLPDGVEPPNLIAWRSAVELSAPVLQQLAEILSNPNTYFSLHSKRNPGAKSKRKAKGGSAEHLAFNNKPFMSLGTAVPTTEAQAQRLESAILTDQRAILSALIDVLRKPELAGVLGEKYTGVKSLPHSLQSSNSIAVEPSPSSAPSDEQRLGRVDLSSLKADLTYSSPIDFGEWRIFTTGRARSDLRDMMQSDGKSFDSVFKKLKELSFGRFSPTNHKPLCTGRNLVDIFRVRLPGDLRIIYQVDCVIESENDVPHQALTVFGLYSHSEMHRELWEKLGRQLGRRGAEYRKACRARSQPRKGNNDTFSPLSFPSLGLIPELVTESAEIVGSTGLSSEEERELHSLTALGKYSVLSQCFIDGLLHEGVAQAYQLSHHERQVVEYTKSSLVLGRSGTGKTTTIYFKMYGIERAWEQTSLEGASRPRQLFVTKSRMLAKRVESDFIEFIRSDALSAHAPQHFKDRIDQFQIQDKKSLFASEDTGLWRSDLPRKFSELQDMHFPLFITFDDLCMMLLNDFLEDDGLHARRSNFNHPTAKSSAASYYLSHKPIDFDEFLSNYWYHLPRSLTKHIAPSLAFGEFLGIIKGCEESLSSSSLCLDRITYDNRRTRHVEYSLFEAYERRRSQREAHDFADRTHYLLSVLKKRAFPGGRKIDYLYVDEVQDNLLTDIALLRLICRNPHGLFWAGDTAQTISFGSAFRFTELSAFLYRYERSAYSGNLLPAESKFFHLLVNYRSPGGVVDCANSVIELLQMFPKAVDELDREKGIIQGMKPLFYSLSDEEGSIDRFFMVGSPKQPSLGADQFILVRNNASKEHFKRRFGKIGNISTLYDSKGQEFDDVIVYNFFGESDIPFSAWRDLCDVAQNRQGKDILLDSRHAPLVTELKFLYVALTRTKGKLWIVDSSERGEPLRELWLAGKIVEIASSHVDISQFAAEEDQDWDKRGREFLRLHHYDDAAEAFDRAGMDREASMARALNKKREAGFVPEEDRARRRKAFKEASSLLLECAKKSASADELAVLFSAAAKCFLELGDLKQAAEAFEQGGLYTEAASHYFDAHQLDDAVRIILQHPAPEVRLDVETRIINSARYLYFNQRKIKEGKALFKSSDELEDFLDTHEFTEAHIAVLEEQDSADAAARAAEMRFKTGDVLGAMDTLIDSGDLSNMKRAWRYGCSFIWPHISFDFHTLATSETERLSSKTLELLVLQRLVRWPKEQLDSDEHEMMNMLQALMTSDITVLLDLSQRFEEGGRTEAVIACLDHYFHDIPRLEIAQQDHVLRFVETFHLYARSLYSVIINESPWESLSLRHLFGIHSEASTSDHDDVALQPGTLLWAAHAARYTMVEVVPTNISRQDLRELIRITLTGRLKAQIVAELAVIEDKDGRGLIEYFNPCVVMSLTGRCNSVHTRPVAHDIGSPGYNRRICFHLRQIEILHISHRLPSIGSSDEFPARMRERRAWLSRLHQAVSPLLYVNGSKSLLDISSIPRAKGAFSVIAQWALDVLFGLDPRKRELEDAFLGNFLDAANLGLKLNDSDSVRLVGSDLLKIPSVPRWWQGYRQTRKPHRMLWYGKEGRSQYAMWPLANFMLGRGDILHAIEVFGMIVNRGIPLNYGLLCDFADRLTGTFILTSIHAAACQNLHNVTLPRTWIVELWPEFLRFINHNTAPVHMLYRILGRILQLLYTGHISNEPGPPNSRSTAKLPPDAVRDACVSRICRDLCLIGYNFMNLDLYAMIFNIIASVRSLPAQPTRHAPVLSRDYLSAKHWPDLARAVRRSCSYESSVDEMVQLWSLAVKEQSMPAEHIRRVRYSSLDDIPALVAFNHSTPNKAQPPIEPTATPLDVQAQIENRAAICIQRAWRARHGYTPNLIQEHDEDQTHTEASEKHQIRAATLIQRVWRIYHRVPKESMDLSRHLWIRQCQKQARLVSWNGRHTLRAAFCVHLPRLLSCTDWVNKTAREERAKIKKRRAGVSFEAQLALMEGLVDMKRLERKAKDMRDLLRPSPQFDLRAGALKRLQEYADKVQDIVFSMPSSLDAKEKSIAAQEISLAQAGLKHARTEVEKSGMGGMVTAMVRPKLNTSDLD